MGALRIPVVFVGGQPQQLQAGDGLSLPAGSAAASSWPTLGSGTLLTTPEVGALENDAAGMYNTIDTTSGRRDSNAQHIYLVQSNQSAIGPTIADYFPANSSFPFVTNGIYEIVYYCFFLKTTAGTVTWTITNTQTYTNIVAALFVTPSAGLQTAGTAGSEGMVTTTAAAAALPATPSLTTAVNHSHTIWALAECATAGNIRLRATSSAGTITPLRGSRYTVRRWPSASVGTFVA